MSTWVEAVAFGVIGVCGAFMTGLAVDTHPQATVVFAAVSASYLFASCHAAVWATRTNRRRGPERGCCQ